MGNRKWTAEELAYMEDRWGETEPRQMARRFGRTIAAVMQQAAAIGLPEWADATDLMRVARVAEIMGVDYHTVNTAWSAKGLPILVRQIRGTRKQRFIRPDVLLKWLKDHQGLWDSRKVELYALGPETDWITEKRERDRKQTTIGRGGRYNDIEDAIIRMELMRGTSTYKIAERLHRTRPSVRGRIVQLRAQDAGGARGPCQRKEG